MWTIRYSPMATAGIYQCPRGVAVIVTDAIRALVIDPRTGDPVAGRPNVYEIHPAGHRVTYTLIEQESIIIILNIE